MTMAIRQLLNCAWKSQAAYLDFSGLTISASADAVNSKLTDPNQINPDNIFTATQAATFTDPAKGFGFTSYRPNDDNGFSATVFKHGTKGVRDEFALNPKPML